MQPGTLDFWPIAEDIFHSLATHYLTLPASVVNSVIYDFCFVIVDRLSGFIKAIPCRKKGLTAQSAPQLFLVKCVHFMGVPYEIFSDNDNLITSDFFEKLCVHLGIVHRRAVMCLRVD